MAIDDQTPANSNTKTHAAQRNSSWWRLSLREFIGLSTIMMLLIGFAVTIARLRATELELARLRAENGYLAPSEEGQIAASRAPSDQPLTYRARIRVPNRSRYRVCYSTLWPRHSGHPEWFAALDLPPGECVLTVKVQADPRDSIWKISAVARSSLGTKRVATTLPEDQVPIFRSSNDAIRAGIGNETVIAEKNGSIRLFDERWLVGGGGVFLYGDRPPEADTIGIFAELQPDAGPI
ncbi:hypothetical protein CA13_52540 [Planctomycetes bacterium CA13]|uniref:Uncharacterized protein n=1 Tax=Novipirellula herctigrandis TaxID=2527986 RepID=A0A5C5ZB51_9BACT|nr:hypothetical protein CA13_52540 [Planctomycetes bacterium CA13]